MRTPDTIYIDFHTAKLSIVQVLEAVGELKAEHPEQEIFMDGDAYAIVGRVRA